MSRTVRFIEGWEEKLLPTGGADNRTRLERYRAILRAGLAQGVTDRQREALLLYYQEGLTVYEVGERLGICPSSAARRVKNGIRRLRELAAFCDACLPPAQEE